MYARGLFKRPSAFLPILMSVGALVVVLLRILVVGTAPESDEGAAAHLWQLLMATQFPVIAFFALRWLPRERRFAVAILGLQGLAGALAATPIWLLGW